MTSLAAPTAIAAPDGWPAAVRAELARRRAALPSGPGVFDLADGSAFARVVAGERLRAGEEPYDAAVSVGALARVADLPGALATILDLLALDGQLHLVEPVGGPGWANVLVGTATAHLAPVRDQHLDRDVPLAVRAGGFVIIDLERFPMPTALPSLRRFVDARAVRYVPFGGAAS